MKSVSNQRIVKVCKAPADKSHYYATCNLSALDEAASLLQTKAGMKLYLYLCKNQNNYNFALSSQHFCEWACVGIDAYRSAFNELVTYGFLVLDDARTNHYSFYEARKVS